MRDILLRGAMAWSSVRYWRPLARRARDPRRAQAETLRSILGANVGTEFGRRHGFAQIRTPDEYRAATPVHDYEMLRPYVEAQRTRGSTALTSEPPIFYAQTSGSTGQPKYIPVTATALEGYRSEQALFSYLQYRVRPDAFAGKAWGIMGAAVEGRLDSGHVVGSVSGHLYKALPGALRARFVVPPEVASIRDYEAKYLLILRLALGEPDVTYLGSPNPSTFVRLLSLLDERRDELARSLEQGTLPAVDGLDDEVMTAVAPRLRRDPARARQLGTSGSLSYASLWPGISLLTTWTGGSCGIALEALRRMLPKKCSVMELGYQATEFRGTLALEVEVQGGLPPLHHHFLEFAPQAAWDAGDTDVCGLEALQAGERYYVFVTTGSGLYRYAMNDIVEVTGWFEQTPLLRFVQKGKGVTSLTGEKLYEAQAIEAVQEVAREHGLPVSFFLLIADESPASYHLYLECGPGDRPDRGAFAAAVDARLGALNAEYRSKRDSGRLLPVALSWLGSGSADAYKTACVAAGQREGQFKPTLLVYRKNLTWPVQRYVVD